jgi:hypothetical protein
MEGRKSKAYGSEKLVRIFQLGAQFILGRQERFVQGLYIGGFFHPGRWQQRALLQGSLAAESIEISVAMTIRRRLDELVCEALWAMSVSKVTGVAECNVKANECTGSHNR